MNEHYQKNIHAGHRKRVRDEFLKNGLENFSDIRALEMLLFYGIPRIDTNPIAHSLIERFGSLYNVLNASVPELMKADLHISESTAILIKAVGEINRKAQIEKERKGKIFFNNSSETKQNIRPYFTGLSNERFMMFCLNSKGEQIKATVVSEGVVNTVGVNIRQAVETALYSSASIVVFAHNHPDGECKPSDDDLYLTKRLKEALGTIGIAVQDHIIVTVSEEYSFAENRLL